MHSRAPFSLRPVRTKKGWRAQPPALAENSCGCFLPDLTRFTTMQCGEARHKAKSKAKEFLARQSQSLYYLKPAYCARSRSARLLQQTIL